MALDLASMFLDLAAAAAAYGRLDDEDALTRSPSSVGEGKVSNFFCRHPIPKDSPSLHPPPHGYPDGGGDRPGFVFIEPYAYFADRHNATTAGCSMEGLRLRGDIMVTFCTAQPPQVSYLCVHATAYDHNVFAIPPRIVATEETDGGIVLLSVVVGNNPSHAMLPHKRHYFVYDAGVPALKHIKHPGDDHQVNENSVAIVRTPIKPDHRSSYVLAAQSAAFGYGNPSSRLCLYHSDTDSWSNLPVNVDSVPYEFTTYKAITIGGDEGVVAWVDLSHMITFCSVLDNKRPKKLGFLRLPVEPTYAYTSGSPAARDVSVHDGFIRFVELQHRANGWKVTIWRIKTGVFSKKAWRIHYQLDSPDIPEPPSLPKLEVDYGFMAQKPTLSTLHIGLPKMSLQDDCILYFLAKIDYRERERTAWVLAVDMKNKTVQRVAEFSPKRSIALSTGYDSSRISKYLKVTPGKDMKTEMTRDATAEIPLQEAAPR